MAQLCSEVTYNVFKLKNINVPKNAHSTKVPFHKIFSCLVILLHQRMNLKFSDYGYLLTMTEMNENIEIIKSS